MSRLCCLLAALLLLAPATGALAKDGSGSSGKGKEPQGNALGQDKQAVDVTMPGATPPTPKTKSVKTTPAAPEPTPTSAPTPAPEVAPGIAKKTDAPALAAGAPALGETVGVAGITGDVRVKASG